MANIAGVTILSGPQDWQILQRDKAGFAAIEITGTWEAEEDYFFIQARLVDENLNMPVTAYLDWQDAELDPAAKRFNIRLERVPTGGLYRVETRVKRPRAADSRALRGDCIHHLGVGDIYIVAGQSNASGTGKGRATDGPMLGVHQFANDEQWKLAAHPLEDATNTLHPITITRIFHGHSPWLAFGKSLYHKTGVPIGLIPAALGGSPVSRWQKEGDLFANMADMLHKAGGKTAGIVWYQGETEVMQGTVDKYPENFAGFVTAARELTGDANLPIFTGQLNACTLEHLDAAAWSQMREHQRALSHRFENIHLIVTIDCPLSDEIHNSAAANVWIGERFAEAALAAVYGQPLLARFPEVTRASFSGESRQSLELECDFVAGDWTPSPSRRDFSVQDAAGWLEVQRLTVGPDHNLRLELARPVQGKATLHGLYGLRPQPGLFDDNGRCITPFSLELD